MSKILSLIRRAPKRFSAVVVMAAAAVIVPAVVLAWGPSRPTFTQAHPASYVTFDSITDNPTVGDERNFVRIREDGNGNYGDNVNFEPGKVYDVTVYYHNNAAANLNLVANNTTLKMEVPGVVKAGVNAALTGTISASNANPTSVWDEAYGKNNTNGDILLRYVSNSATFVSNGAVNGQKLPDSLFTTGAKLGYNAQDGNVPGCNQYAGYVNFKIRVDQPNFTVSKLVSTDDGKTWSKNVTAQPGQTIQYGLSFQNTGTTQLDNVIVRDMLPAGVTYVNGSTSVINSNTGGQYKPTIDAVASSTGINAGSFQPKGNVFYKFSAKLPSEDALKCGTNSLVNTERATTSAGYKEDTATVTVNRECKPPVVKYTCDALNITKVDDTHFKFSTAYTAQNATFKSVTYVVKNASGATVDTKTSTGTTLDYTQATPGNYTVQATVTFSVNGQDKTATSDSCKGSFEVKEKPPVVKYTCDALQVVTVDSTHFKFTTAYTAENATFKSVTYVIKDASGKVVDTKTSNGTSLDYTQATAGNYSVQATVTFTVNGQDKTATSENCKGNFQVVPNKITVCDLTTKQIVTINESDFDASKYSKDLSKCKETPPAQITVCDLSTKQVVTINESDFDANKYSKDLTVCQTTPPELPHTGMGENIVAIVGLGALVASAAYYIASRRALNQ